MLRARRSAVTRHLFVSRPARTDIPPVRRSVSRAGGRAAAIDSSQLKCDVCPPFELSNVFCPPTRVAAPQRDRGKRCSYGNSPVPRIAGPRAAAAGKNGEQGTRKSTQPADPNPIEGRDSARLSKRGIPVHKEKKDSARGGRRR